MYHKTSLFNTDVAAMREVYFKAWRKIELNEPLDPIEKQIAQLMHEHPEYKEIFSQPEKYSDYQFADENGEMNPFLHLGLHLSIHEQVATNRPKGITSVYKDLVDNFGDAHHAEHHIMDILAENVLHIVKSNQMVDDKNYLKQLKKLLKKGCHHAH